MFDLFIYVYSCNALSARFFDVDRALNSYFMIMIMFIKLFSLGVTAEASRANIGTKSAISLQRGPVDPRFQVKRVVPRQPFIRKLG